MNNIKRKKIYIVNNLIKNISKDIKFNEEIYYFNYLNFIRPHNIFLQKYDTFFQKNKTLIYFILLKFFFKFFIFSLINIIRSLYPIRYKTIINCDSLIISHLINNEDLNKDRYFGDFNKYLKKKKLNPGRLLFNYNNRNVDNNHKNIFIINKYGDFILEIKIIFKQIYLFIKYYRYKKIINKNKKIELNFYKNFLINIISNESRNNIRFLEILKKIKKYNKIKYLFCTLEGHNWEKIAFYFFKKNSKVKTFGYTSSLIFNNQKLFNNAIINKSIPDIILTNCNNNYKLLKKDNYVKEIINIGNLNYEQYNIKNKFQKYYTNFNHICLILPENIESEFFYFVNFVKKYCLEYNNIKFVLKLHPGMNNNKRIKKTINNCKFKNLSFSKGDTTQEISNANSILYRGSSAVLHALLQSKRIIYLNDKFEININPLFTNEASIDIITTPFELNKLIKTEKKHDYLFIHEYINKIEFENINKYLV